MNERQDERAKRINGSDEVRGSGEMNGAGVDLIPSVKGADDALMLEVNEQMPRSGDHPGEVRWPGLPEVSRLPTPKPRMSAPPRLSGGVRPHRFEAVRMAATLHKIATIATTPMAPAGMAAQRPLEWRHLPSWPVHYVRQDHSTGRPT
jgi:hypothetical protein